MKIIQQTTKEKDEMYVLPKQVELERIVGNTNN